MVLWSVFTCPLQPQYWPDCSFPHIQTVVLTDSLTVHTVVPELMMEGRGLAVRPTETPPAGPGSAVPSPLQSSCRVCSCPGMEMDFAVLGGLQGKKTKTPRLSVWNRLNEHIAEVLLRLAHWDKINFIGCWETAATKETGHCYICKYPLKMLQLKYKGKQHNTNKRINLQILTSSKSISFLLKIQTMSPSNSRIYIYIVIVLYSEQVADLMKANTHVLKHGSPERRVIPMITFRKCRKQNTTF